MARRGTHSKVCVDVWRRTPSRWHTDDDYPCTQEAIYGSELDSGGHTILDLPGMNTIWDMPISRSQDQLDWLKTRWYCEWGITVLRNWYVQASKQVSVEA